MTNLDPILAQENLTFEYAKQRALAAQEAAQKAIADDKSEKIKDLTEDDLTHTDTLRKEAALLLKVVNDVANALKQKVTEVSKKEDYPFELSGYQIAEEGIQRAEAAAEELKKISSGNSYESTLGKIQTQIDAHDPNKLPEAKKQDDKSLSSYRGSLDASIEAARDLAVYPEDSLTIDNMGLGVPKNNWNINAIHGGTKAQPDSVEVTEGKVRTTYWLNNQVGVMVARDTTSANDIPKLTNIPGKGAMLTGITNYWLDNVFKAIGVKHSIGDHRVGKSGNIDPQKFDPNVTIAQKVSPLPVEVVLRRYLTGSAHKKYEEGERVFGSHKLPNDLKRNDRLDSVIVDPTMKGRNSDLKISDGTASALVGFDDWDKIKKVSTELFEAAEKKAKEKGLVLVDTKFEFGKKANGEIVLIDEVLTPDSSRFWSVDNYLDLKDTDKDPDDYSKQPLRDWIREKEEQNPGISRFRGYKSTYVEALGEVPDELVTKLAKRYATVYHALTGKKFSIPMLTVLASDQGGILRENLSKAGLWKGSTS